MSQEDPTTVPLRVEMVNVAEFPPFLTLGIEVKLTKSRKIFVEEGKGKNRKEVSDTSGTLSCSMRQLVGMYQAQV